MTAAPPTSELAAFIEARLSEDEAAARAATTGPWGYGEPRQTEESPWPTTSVWTGEAGNAHTEADNEADATHIARHDPARVLAQVAALRAVVELHRPDAGGYACAVCLSDRRDYPEAWEADDLPCPTLRHLAAIWADNEAFDPAWSA